MDGTMEFHNADISDESDEKDSPKKNHIKNLFNRTQ